MKELKRINYTFKFILLILIFFPLSNIQILSQDNLNEKNVSARISEKDSSSLEDIYILGSGDFIRIVFEGLDMYTNNFLVDKQGFIKLPEIGYLSVQGKTMSEVKKDLLIEYEEYIYDPQFDLEIVVYRPVKAYLLGEITNPGLYNLKKFAQIESSNTEVEKGLATNAFSTPKLFEVITEAGGVTNFADLSRVEIIRNNPKSFGGGKIKTEVDLIKMIVFGDQSLNINIYDGDIIKIPKSETPIKEQMLAVNSTNINPSMINIFISGNATTTGPFKIKRGSSLVQALALSGGKKIFSGKIEFIRFSSNGEISKRLIRYSSDAKVNSYVNPLLFEGDVIHVRKTPLGTATEAIATVTTPIYTSFSLFKLLGVGD